MLLHLTHSVSLAVKSLQSENFLLYPGSFLELRRLGRQCEQTTCPRLLSSRIVAGPGREPKTSGPDCQRVVTELQWPIFVFYVNIGLRE